MAAPSATLRFRSIRFNTRALLSANLLSYWYGVAAPKGSTRTAAAVGGSIVDATPTPAKQVTKRWRLRVPGMVEATGA
jgi:hypothetical protein